MAPNTRSGADFNMETTLCVAIKTADTPTTAATLKMMRLSLPSFLMSIVSPNCPTNVTPTPKKKPMVPS